MSFSLTLLLPGCFAVVVVVFGLFVCFNHRNRLRHKETRILNVKRSSLQVKIWAWEGWWIRIQIKLPLPASSVDFNRSSSLRLHFLTWKNGKRQVYLQTPPELPSGRKTHCTALYSLCWFFFSLFSAQGHGASKQRRFWKQCLKGRVQGHLPVPT